MIIASLLFITLHFTTIKNTLQRLFYTTSNFINKIKSRQALSAVEPETLIEDDHTIEHDAAKLTGYVLRAFIMSGHRETNGLTIIRHQHDSWVSESSRSITKQSNEYKYLEALSYHAVYMTEQILGYIPSRSARIYPLKANDRIRAILIETGSFSEEEFQSANSETSRRALEMISEHEKGIRAVHSIIQDRMKDGFNHFERTEIDIFTQQIQNSKD